MTRHCAYAITLRRLTAVVAILGSAALSGEKQVKAARTPEAVRLTTTGDNSMPAYSPDGRYIAYAHGPQNAASVFVMNADGTGQRPVTTNVAVSTVEHRWLKWSPDGGSILFTGYSSDSLYESVFVVAVNGSGEAVNISGSSTAAIYPDWSADGTRVIFARPSGICTVQLSDRAEAPLTQSLITWGDQWPRYSPDGSQIVFDRRVDDLSTTHLALMNADGSGLFDLTSDLQFEDVRPQWSPDGKSLLFIRSNEYPFDAFVMVYDLRRRTMIQLTSAFNVDLEPAWSPNGRRIAFSSEYAYTLHNGDLFVVNSDATRPVQLTDTVESEGPPSWSPKGQRLAFDAAPDLHCPTCGSEIYVLTAAADQ